MLFRLMSRCLRFLILPRDEGTVVSSLQATVRDSSWDSSHSSGDENV